MNRWQFYICSVYRLLCFSSMQKTYCPMFNHCATVVVLLDLIVFLIAEVVLEFLLLTLPCVFWCFWFVLVLYDFIFSVV